MINWSKHLKNAERLWTSCEKVTSPDNNNLTKQDWLREWHWILFYKQIKASKRKIRNRRGEGNGKKIKTKLIELLNTNNFMIYKNQAICIKIMQTNMIKIKITKYQVYFTEYWNQSYMVGKVFLRGNHFLFHVKQYTTTLLSEWKYWSTGYTDSFHDCSCGDCKTYFQITVNVFLQPGEFTPIKWGIYIYFQHFTRVFLDNFPFVLCIYVCEV